MRLQLRDQFRIERRGRCSLASRHTEIWRKHDERLHYRSSLPIWLRHDSCVDDRRMLDKAVLDFAGADAVSGGLEHVISATLVPEVAIFITSREVPCAAPVAG